MPTKRFLSGLEEIFGPPGVDGIVVDYDRLFAFRDLMHRMGLHKMRPRDIADSYLSLLPGKDRSKRGVYYTPAQVVNYILDEVMPPPRIGRKKGTDPYSHDFRLLEPACGAGYFLIAAFDRMLESYTRAGFKPGDAAMKILGDRISAIDIDPSALLAATAALLQQAGDALEIELVKSPLRLPFFQVDFLNRDFDRSKSNLGKMLRAGVPAIVGNPPYVSFYAKRAKSISIRDREYYKRTYRMGKGRINTYCLFIERAFDLLSPSGVLGYIVPNTILIMKSYEPLRKYLLEQGWLRSIVDLSLKVFPEVEVPTCIMVVEKKDPRALPFPRESKTGFWESARMEAPLNLETTSQENFLDLPYTMFNIHIREADREILNAIESAGRPLGENFDVRDGINPANMSEKLIRKSVENLSLPFRKVLRGKDIAPFQLSWDNLWVRYDPGFADKSRGEYCFLREERIFREAPKILTRQTADRIIAAIDHECYYALNSIHVTIPLNGGINLLALLGLYNSKLLNYYYRLVFPDTERVFPQVKTVNLERLPLPELDGTEDILVGLVGKMVGSASGKNGINRNGILKVRREIDDLVYGIYHLNPQQIARIENSPYTE